MARESPICFVVPAFSRRVLAAPQARPGGPYLRIRVMIRVAVAPGVAGGGGPGEGPGQARSPGGIVMLDADSRAVVPGLRLGHPLHVQAGQRRGFAAALLLQPPELVRWPGGT